MRVVIEAWSMDWSAWTETFDWLSVERLGDQSLAQAGRAIAWRESDREPVSLRGLAKRGLHSRDGQRPRSGKSADHVRLSQEQALRRGGIARAGPPVPPPQLETATSTSENGRGRRTRRSQGDRHVVARSVQGACETDDDRARRRRHSTSGNLKRKFDERRRKSEPPCRHPLFSYTIYHRHRAISPR